jgi:putative transposase
MVAVGCPHHITQRGSSRCQLFFRDADREVYLTALRKYADRYRMRVWGYCLMSNHIHLIGVPENPDSLSRTLGRTHADYARYINVARQGCGHFWQARFYSCPLDQQQVWNALAYVERNPVRAGLVAQASGHRWSSAGAHLCGHDPSGWLELQPWQASYVPEQWANILALGMGEQAFRERLHQATLTGLPLGDETFVRRWEALLGRPLRWRPPGRPASLAAMRRQMG